MVDFHEFIKADNNDRNIGFLMALNISGGSKRYFVYTPRDLRMLKGAIPSW
jgi:hypothetical protein